MPGIVGFVYSLIIVTIFFTNEMWFVWGIMWKMQDMDSNWMNEATAW